MSAEEKDSRNVGRSFVDIKAFFIGIAAILIVLALELYFLRELTLLGVLSAFGVFTVTYFSAIVLIQRMNIINELLEFKIRFIWFLLMTIAFLLIIAYTIDHYQLGGVEGKAKCVFPDSIIRLIDIKETECPELERIFPQIFKIPFSGIGTFATNGKINTKYHNESTLGGSDYLEISLKNRCNTTDCNSGLMFGPLGGFDVYDDYSHLSFEVKGAKGEEMIGVKMKDTDGKESKVEVGPYTNITRIWQDVEIPLDHFDNIFGVDLTKLDVITIYSDGNLYSKSDPEILYVRNFRFLNLS